MDIFWNQTFQYAEYGKCRHEPFLKMVFAHTKIVALHAAALGLQRVFYLTFRGITMIFFAKSILTSQFAHFPHPSCLHVCFLISTVRLCTNEWTGNLSVILFVAFLLSELYGKASTYQGGPGSPQENLKFSI